MEKIKRIFVGAVMCMMLMLYSSDAVAQSFVDGATAISNLDQELDNLSSSLSALDVNSSTYSEDAAELGRKSNAVGWLVRRGIDGSSSTSDVSIALKEIVIVGSSEFVRIDEAMYDSGSFGSTEITDLQSYLQNLLTN